MDDYERAMEAYRNADALAPQPASHQLETLLAEPEPQFTPTEDLFVQPILNYNLKSMPEQAPQPEPVEPVVNFPADHLPAAQVQATRPAAQENEYISWLDGFAAAMAEFHQHEARGAAGNLAETEKIPETPSSQPEAATLASQAEQPLQPTEADGTWWDEAASAFPYRFSFPDSTPDQDMSGTHESETSAPAKANPVEPPASQAGTEIEEENAHLWNELGSIYFNTGAYEEAINAFKKAIQLDHTYGWSYNNLAALYSRQGRYKDAIPLYQKGLQYLGEARDKALLWNRLGDTYRRLDEHDQAAAAYRKAMELDPDNVSLLTRARFSLLGNCRA
jgi:tetratricopeptide (TPR) repeat protein